MKDEAVSKISLRDSFNEDEANYDAARPGYPRELYEDVFDYVKDRISGTRAIEVGIGTGQATKPFLDAGFQVTAIEIGDKLAALAAEKFRAYPGFRVLCTDFMEALPEEEACADLIYAGTAFHWLPKPDGYLRAKELLANGGVIALFWNHPYARMEEDPTNVASAEVYERLRPDGKTRRPFGEEDMEPIIADLCAAGFKDLRTKLYHRTRILTTEQYIALLNTYSDHRKLDPALKERFEKEMREALERVGGFIRMYDTLDLYLAEKRA